MAKKHVLVKFKLLLKLEVLRIISQDFLRGENMESKLEILKDRLYDLKYTKVLKAVSLAEFAHFNQYRLDKITPFIEHPVAVCEYLLDKGITDEFILSVALLHDVLEDTNTDEDMIEYLFDRDTVEAIKALSKRKGADVIPYFAKIEKKDELVMIKAADRIHNLGDMDNVFTEEKKRKYRLESMYVLDMVEKRANQKIFIEEFKDLKALIYPQNN